MDTSQLKFPKSRPRVLDRIDQKAALAKQERACRKAVKARDAGRCRHCMKRATELHHLERRSRGGTWQTFNIVSLCLGCHRLTHAALLLITGNADGSLMFEVTR